MKNLLLFIILLTNFMFSSEPVLVGSAKLDTTNQLNWKDFYLLTPGTMYTRGALWFSNPLPNFNSNFMIDIVANFGNDEEIGHGQGTGADGIGLVFHRDPRAIDSVIGSPGMGIGYGYGAGQQYGFGQWIQNSFTIEFDTYDNSSMKDQQNNYYDDIEKDHIDIRFNGNLTNISANK